jgi:hypothetical protein
METQRMNRTLPNMPEAKPDPLNLSYSELVSNQEARVVPWFVGCRKIPVTWVAPVYDIKHKTLKAPPNGLEDAFQIAQWFDLGALTLGGFDSIAKDASQPKTKAYFGTMVGVVCAGPVDELVAILVNGGTIWPTSKTWADGVVDLPSVQRRRVANKASVEFVSPHKLHQGKKFVLSGLSDGSFNVAVPAAVLDNNDVRMKYANAGADVAWVDDVGGRLTKVVHYESGDLVRDGSGIWRCILAHDGTPDKRPPHATYWEPHSVARADSDNPFGFTLEGYGDGWFYWGTTDQTLDTVGEQVLSKRGHPAYRRQAVLVLKEFLMGTQRSAAPNIEVVVRRKAAQAVISGDALDGDSQANPLAAAAELLTDPVFGIGQADAADETTWQAVADALADEAAKTFISPQLDTSMSFRSFLVLLLAYYDGWMRFNNAGAIEAGRFLHNEAPPVFTAATTIDFNDLEEEIQYTADGWAGTFNETLVKFDDGARAFKGAAQKYVSGYNRDVVGEPRLASLERPWISREQQALDYAGEWGKINAQPALRGTLVVRAEKAASIAAGSVFKLTHDAVGFSVVCRCVERTPAAPPAGRVTLKFENERGIAPIPYRPTNTVEEPPAPAPAERVALYQFVQPPSSTIGQRHNSRQTRHTNDYQLTVLAARTHATTRGYTLWMQAEDDDLFYDLGQSRHWAVKGTLAQNYAATAAADDDGESLQLNLDEFTVASDLAKVSLTQSEDAINDDALQIWLFKDADRTQFEILTVKAIRLNAGVYKLKVRRARGGTAQLAFTTGDHAWIVYRGEVVTYRQEKFEVYAGAATELNFRLQSFTAGEEADLTDEDVCPDVAFTFEDPHAPTVEWNVEERASGTSFTQISDFTHIYSTASKFRFGAKATSHGRRS